jgi:hypothetical protein
LCPDWIRDGTDDCSGSRASGRDRVGPADRRSPEPVRTTHPPGSDRAWSG